MTYYYDDAIIEHHGGMRPSSVVAEQRYVIQTGTSIRE
jgi:hypothetical protein